MVVQAEKQSAMTKNHLGYAVLACVCIIVIAVCWHAQSLGVGELWHYDEFYSYDRARGFSAMSDWLTVYHLGAPTLKKPPLQYWMSAALMEAGVQHVLAMRIPSMLFTACAMMATAALAYAMFPKQVWLMPCALLLLSTSTQFWEHATSAMLDTGAAFFSTLGVLSLFLSLKDPRYWPTFPIAVFLAGLQKGPTPLGFLLMALIGLALLAPLYGGKLLKILKDRRFVFSTLAAVILGFAWQIFQKIRYSETDSLRGNIERQMLKRFLPENAEILSPGLERISDIILAGEPVIRVAGFAGLLLLPFIARRPAYFAMSSIVVLFVVVMIFASGKIFARYTLTILPLLCIGAAWLIFFFCRKPAIAIIATVTIVLPLGGPLRPWDDLAQSRPGRYSVPISQILSPLNDAITVDETAIFCGHSTRTIPPGAIHVYAPQAGTGHPIYIRDIKSIERNMQDYEGGPVRGICREAEIDAIRPYFSDLETEPVIKDFVMWTATSYSAHPSD